MTAVVAMARLQVEELLEDSLTGLLISTGTSIMGENTVSAAHFVAWVIGEHCMTGFLMGREDWSRCWSFHFEAWLTREQTAIVWWTGVLVLTETWMMAEDDSWTTHLYSSVLREHHTTGLFGTPEGWSDRVSAPIVGSVVSRNFVGSVWKVQKMFYGCLLWHHNYTTIMSAILLKSLSNRPSWIRNFNTHSLIERQQESHTLGYNNSPVLIWKHW